MRFRRLGFGLVSCFAIAALCSCRSVPGFPYTAKGIPAHHIVMIDTNGRLVDPTGDSDCTTSSRSPRDYQRELSDYGFVHTPAYDWTPCIGRFRGINNRDLEEPERYLEQLVEEMHRYHEQWKPPNERRIRRVAIIIHGGLNETRGNLETARDVSARMLADPGAPYPIFVNWQSNLWASLWDHLVKVRQGDSKDFRHSFLFPAYLAADVLKGVGRAPATWFYHYGNEIERLKLRFTNEQTRADQLYCELRDRYRKCLSRETEGCSTFPISKGPFLHSYGEGTRSTVAVAPTGYLPVRYYPKAIGRMGGNRFTTWLPVKLFIAPLLDGLGTSAWDTMIRHVQVGFHNDGVSNPGRQDSNQTSQGLPSSVVEPPEGNGGISQFLRRLREEIQTTSCRSEGSDPSTCLDWELTLIGHSMGAIVANHVLYEFSDLEFKDIVYMAAACSVNDYERSVLEYLKKHDKTQMYHLTLHDFAEIRDQYFFEIPPSGSLLVWIDNFLSKPATLRDRTAGRFVNLMISLPATPEHLRSRIHVKTFGVGEELAWTDPQKHGAFNDFVGPPFPTAANDFKDKVERDPSIRFWSCDFWDPETSERPTRKQRCPAEPVYKASPADSR